MYDVSLLMKANSRIQKRRPILQDGHFIFVSDEPFLMNMLLLNSWHFVTE